MEIVGLLLSPHPYWLIAHLLLRFVHIVWLAACFCFAHDLTADLITHGQINQAKKSLRKDVSCYVIQIGSNRCSELLARGFNGNQMGGSRVECFPWYLVETVTRSLMHEAVGINVYSKQLSEQKFYLQWGFSWKESKGEYIHWMQQRTDSGGEGLVHCWRMTTSALLSLPGAWLCSHYFPFPLLPFSRLLSELIICLIKKIP